MELKRNIRKTAELGIGLTAIAALILAGCGGGGGASGGGAATSATIIPFKGPFSSGATVALKDANGNPVYLISGGMINASGVANVTYSANVTYPLIVEVTGGYYNENTGAMETATVPLRGLISSAGAASSVPVTIVTETAVADLQTRLGSFAPAHPIQAASAVAALNVAGAMLGIPASAVPAFNPVTHQTGDRDTLRLAAWAVVANGRTGTTLLERVRALANSLAALNPASAPVDVINQAAYNNALAAMTSGASSVMAAGATAPTPPAIPTANRAALYASAVAAASTTGTAGYPATGTFAGKLSDGSACTVDVAADHSVTVSATSWPYTGSVKTTLDGFYFESTNSEIAPAIFYTGTSRFFESNAGNFTAATKTAPAYNTGLSFDASTGKLIMAMGSVVTDIASTPTVGANFRFSCVGNAFPASGYIAPSEFNKAPSSNFKATSLVGTFNAPSNVNGTAACSFTVDATGNLTITSANFKNGSMSVPYTLLDQIAANNNANLATYNAYSDATGVMTGVSKQGADWFLVTLSNVAGVKTAAISVNGNGPGSTSTGSTALSGAKPISCSTANDPNAKWTAYGAANVGTYVGAVDKNANFTGVGTVAACTLKIAADGTSTYTGTSGRTKIVKPGVDLPPLTTDNLYFDFAAANNAAWPTFSVSLGPNAGTAQSGQLIGRNVFYALSNGGIGTQEYCLNMVKQ